MRRIIIFSLISLLLCSCSAGNLSGDIFPKASEKPTAGGELTLYAPSPDTFNPLFTKLKGNLDILKLIFEPMFALDSSFKPQGVLIKSFAVSQDGMNYTFTLNDNVKWHDNSAFTANDIEYTFNQIRYGNYDSPFRANLSGVVSYRAVGSNVFDVSLMRGYANFPAMLTFPIIKKSDSASNFFNYYPNGTGEFVFQKEIKGRQILITANKSYHGEHAPYIDKITINELPDKKTAINSFEARIIDILYMDFNDFANNATKTDVLKNEIFTSQFGFLAPNYNTPVFADVYLRQAINMAIDKEKIVSEVLLTFGKKTNSPIHPQSWLGATPENISEFNVQKAKKYLAQNGWTDIDNDGILEKNLFGSDIKASFTVLVNEDNPVRLKTLDAICSMLKEIGIAATAKSVKWEDYNSLINSRNFEAFLGEVKISPDMDLSSLLASYGNYVSYSSPQMDDLLSKITKATDDNTKKEYFRELILKFSQDLPYIPLYFKSDVLLYKNEVKGIDKPSYDNIYESVYNLYLKK